MVILRNFLMYKENIVAYPNFDYVNKRRAGFGIYHEQIRRFIFLDHEGAQLRQ